MEKKCRFSYNEIDDSLIISCKEQNEIIKENFMFDDVIFHLTNTGKIAGLQIRNTSSMLSESGLNPKILDNLTGVGLTVIQKEHSLFIGLNLVSEIEKTKLPLGRIFMPQFKTI